MRGDHPSSTLWTLALLLVNACSPGQGSKLRADDAASKTKIKIKVEDSTGAISMIAPAETNKKLQSIDRVLAKKLKPAQAPTIKKDEWTDLGALRLTVKFKLKGGNKSFPCVVDGISLDGTPLEQNCASAQPAIDAEACKKLGGEFVAARDDAAETCTCAGEKDAKRLFDASLLLNKKSALDCAKIREMQALCLTPVKGLKGRLTPESSWEACDIGDGSAPLELADYGSVTDFKSKLESALIKFENGTTEDGAATPGADAKSGPAVRSLPPEDARAAAVLPATIYAKLVQTESGKDSSVVLNAYKDQDCQQLWNGEGLSYSLQDLTVSNLEASASSVAFTVKAVNATLIADSDKSASKPWLCSAVDFGACKECRRKESKP